MMPARAQACIYKTIHTANTIEFIFPYNDNGYHLYLSEEMRRSFVCATS